MAKTVTSLTGVRTKSGNSAKGAWTLSIFSAADGREYSTFDGALASKANSLLNQPLEIEYSSGRDPEKYPNSLTLESIESTTKTVTNPVREVALAATAAQKNDQFRTKEQIMRTDALNAALTLFGIIGLDPISGVDEFEGWYGSLYKLIETGVFETPGVAVEA